MHSFKRTTGLQQLQAASLEFAFCGYACVSSDST